MADPVAMSIFGAVHNDTYPFISPVHRAPSNHRVLVTGSSKGIGRATAISFARAGASHIAIHGRAAADLDETASLLVAAASEANRPAPTVVKLRADLTSAAAVTEMAATVAEAFGRRLDVLVSNAGALEPWMPLADADPDTWWWTWEVNVRGAFLVARAFIPLLLASTHSGGGGAGTLIQVTSAGGLATMPGASAYQGSKTAQIRMAGHVAVEYAQKGLLVYSVHPGSVATDLASGMPKEVRDHMPVETLEMAADTMVWLCRERREWLMGRYVNAPWDMERMLAARESIVEGDLLKLRLAV